MQVNTHFVAVCFMGELFMCTCRIMHGEWVSNVGKVYHKILPLGGGKVEKPSPRIVKICAYTCFLKIDFISQRLISLHFKKDIAEILEREQHSFKDTSCQTNLCVT